MASTLLRNPTNIGDIFFSGSQSITKGAPVAWIIPDVWAFKTTEACAISMNATPFVEVGAGQTFLVYKRTQADIDAGNSKGLYVFDRDTVIALAYPQEVTQDIIIENDIYNNNLSTVIIEADQTPVANITVSSPTIVGTQITVSGASSYPISPATITSYEWEKNGVSMGTAVSFNYTPTVSQVDNIQLIITDNNGRKATAVSTINVEPAPVFDDILVSKTYVGYDNANEDVETTQVFSFYSTEDATGDIQVVAAIPVESVLDGSTCRVRIKKNGTTVATKDTYIGGNQVKVCDCTYSVTGAILATDAWTVTIIDITGTAREYDTGVYANGSYNEATLSVTNRTA